MMTWVEAIKSAIPSGVRLKSRSIRAQLPHRPRPVILMYHRVAFERFDPWNLSVTPENFGEQLSWLSKQRTVLPLAEFAALQRDRTLPADAVSITFDDGYACVAEVAAPLLNEFQLPATIFLPAEIISQERLFWWDELQAIVTSHRGTSLRLADAE